MKKIISIFAVSGILVASVFAQGVSMPTIGSVSSPSMPTIDAPTLGGSYYRPGIKSNKTTSSNAASTASVANSTKDEKKSSDSTTQKVEDILSTLTAGEIQSLNVNSILGNVLDQESHFDAITKALNQEKEAKETDELLKQVLTEMEEIKKQNKQNQQDKQNVQTVSTASATATKGAGSRLLRFKVNGYDVLHTCRTVFISDVQDDGSFLVTGDRKYQSDGATRTETFHLLFKADSGANGVKSYNAAAAVTQDYLNENSFLYQMSQKNELQANRTGNLVTMRTSDPNWKLELLIDLEATSK